MVEAPTSRTRYARTSVDVAPIIDADAELDPTIRRRLGVAFSHGVLDFDRASHRVHDALKLDENAVASVLDRAARVFADFGIDHLSEVRFEPLVRSLLIRPH